MADTERNKPSPVSNADSPTATANNILNLANLNIVDSPQLNILLKPPLTQHKSISEQTVAKAPHSSVTYINPSTPNTASKVQKTFSDQDIDQYKNFISHSQHFINTTVDDGDSWYLLTFTCLKTPAGHHVLALVDSGSTMSMILDKKAQKLNLPQQGTTNLTIAGFNTSASQNASIYSLTLSTTQSNQPITFMIVGTEALPGVIYTTPKLSPADKRYVSHHKIDTQQVPYSHRLNGRKIDMIIGNDLIPWLNSTPTYKKHILPSGRALEETPLGCIIHPVPYLSVTAEGLKLTKTNGLPSVVHMNYAAIMLEQKEAEDELTRLILEINQMWRTENLGIENITVQEEFKKTTLDLLSAFNNTARFNESGELEVALPYNGNEGRLASNYAVAYRRLKSLIETLKRGNTLLGEYDKIILDQEKAGFIERVTASMLNVDLPQYYIPHRAVVKMESATTKVRIVLDASSHSRDNISLNDCLHAGTNMITPIFGILLRSRCTRYIIVADIEKAFHQVRLQEEFRNVTCFLWVKDLQKPPTGDNLITFRFTRIPFGVASSPFLLAAYIVNFLDNNPTAMNKEIRDNLYVDNTLFCTNDRAAIPTIIADTKAIFTNMKMNLREYIVNDPESMKALPATETAKSDTIKLLGYRWDSISDSFSIKVAALDIDHPTKREVASKLATTFDPLGLASPIMVRFKRLVQKIWNENVDWKKLIPAELLHEWKILRSEFVNSTLTIPRQLTTDYSDSQVELIMFADASQDIYACAVYAHFTRQGQPPITTLIASKNKIRPAKSENWTIPKLELLAITCGSNIATAIVGEIRLNITRIRLMTDSMCALYWILTEARKRIFVANRVTTIQDNKELMLKCGIETTIHHCPTDQNPADYATRGMSTNELQNSSEWFHGPKFLQDPPDQWPCKVEGKVACPAEFQKLVYDEIIDPTTQKKKKPLLERPKRTEKESTVLVVTSKSGHQPSFVPYNATNSLFKLSKIVYFVLKALTIGLKSKKWESYTMQQFTSTPSRIQRLMIARSTVIREHYKDCLYRNIPLPRNTRDHRYELSSDGLYRLKTSVQSPVLPQEAGNPVLIHNKHPLAAMLISETHQDNFHLPVQYTRTAIRTKYWIPQDGYLVSKVIDKCIKCKKVNGKPYAYPYSKVLPHCRTTPSKPFSKVGLDYLGPLFYRKDDGVTLGKCYVLIYTCLCTRGALLRVVPDSTTERYIMTLKMIFGEVGVPEEIYSDNAATFKLGASVINRDINDLQISHSLTTFLASKEINYRYITPLAPWQGGVYERVVGLVKHTIYKECGTQIYDYHSLCYLVSGAQKMVNSRPLMPHSRSPGDMITLRPIDFLNPGVMIDTPATTTKPDGTQGTTEATLRAHLSQLEMALDRMWKLWCLGFLLYLKQNMHQNKKCSQLKPKVGTVVMVETDLVQRHKWPLGIIVRVDESTRDGEIRTAIVRSRGKEYPRTVCQLIPLETEPLNHLDHEDTVDDSEDQYKSRPVLPTPASFDLPDTQYAPPLFPTDNLPNICEPLNSDHYALPLDLDSFNRIITAQPSIGDKDKEKDQEDQADQDAPEADTNNHQNPTATVPDVAAAATSSVNSESRSRPFLPRQAKRTDITYSYVADISLLSLPSPRECRQSCPYSDNPADWIVL